MKLDDIQSKELLPRFAAKIAWMMNALDIVIKAVKSHIPAIEAPLTMQAIQTLSDEELEAWYARYGVIEYYPELSRETREKMLYWLARFYRYLGTPESVHVLCDYIFDNAPLGVEVWDNLAFNDEGELVDSSLLDLFDIFINAHTSTIGIAQYDRIIANVLKIARNSQALRNIYFRYEDEIQIPVRCADYIGFAYRIGDDYELSRPVTPAPSYEEITLYLDSASKLMQVGVTSSFTGDVESSYCYTLYTDEGLTIPWTGFDYSHDYEIGRYTADGEWERTPIQSVGEMPNATVTLTSNAKNGRTILDTNKLWLYTNYIYEGYYRINISRITVRIYPKDQQYYAGYFRYNNPYSNYSLGASRPLYPWPDGTSVNYKAWFAAYPTASFVKFLGSAMNELSDVGNVSLSNDSSFALYVARTGYSGTINVRCVIYTLNTHTFYAWVQSDKSEITLYNNTSYTLYDSSGAPIPYDSSVSYKAIGIFISNGANCLNERNRIAGSSISSVNGNLAFKQVSGGSVVASKIWYIKTPIA